MAKGKNQYVVPTKERWSVGSVRFANVHTSEGMASHLLFPSIFL